MLKCTFSADILLKVIARASHQAHFGQLKTPGLHHSTAQRISCTELMNNSDRVVTSGDLVIPPEPHSMMFYLARAMKTCAVLSMLARPPTQLPGTPLIPKHKTLTISIAGLPAPPLTPSPRRRIQCSSSKTCRLAGPQHPRLFQPSHTMLPFISTSQANHSKVI